MTAVAPLPPRPRMLEAGVFAAIAAGIANAALAAVLLGRAGAVQVPSGVDPQAVSSLLTGIAVAAIVYSAALVVLALLLRAGRLWARVVLLAISVLGLLNLLAATSPGVAVVVLLGVADYALLRQDVRAWVEQVRRGRATGAS